MTLTFTDVLITVALFTCVPLQYFLVQNWGTAEANRPYVLNKFINKVVNFRDAYLNFNSWTQWLVTLLNLEHIFPIVQSDVDPDEGESLAIEVLRYKHQHGYFSFSPEPRIHRPPNVQFRIGQVVMHKNWKYRGVIVGWDEIAKAPPEWLDEMYGKNNREWRDMPNYSILVDTRDRMSPQLTYVPQVNLVVVKNTMIIHPLLENHFETYDGTQYIPRPWLRTLYPQD